MVPGRVDKSVKDSNDAHTVLVCVEEVHEGHDAGRLLLLLDVFRREEVSKLGWHSSSQEMLPDLLQGSLA